MVKFPKNNSPSGDPMLRDAKTLMEYHFEHFTLHGIRFGRGMETISTPRFSKGILITWPFGTLGFSLTENPTTLTSTSKNTSNTTLKTFATSTSMAMSSTTTRTQPCLQELPEENLCRLLDKINYLMMVRWKFPMTTRGKTQRRGHLSSLLRRRSRRSCGLQQNFYINDQSGG